MGSALSKIFKKKEARILMLGLDGAGKTTILYKLKSGKTISVHTPTIGYNVETLKYKKLQFSVWDLGGDPKARPLWRHYYEGSHAVIFVFDSSDYERAEDAREELERILTDPEMAEVYLLVFANKSDIDGAMNEDDVERTLDLKRLGRPYRVQSTCGLTGAGLTEGLQWLGDSVGSANLEY